MKPALFEYSAPKTVHEAIALLATDPGAMVLAGGQSLVPAMNLRLASPSRLVDIQHVAGLHGISVEGGKIVVKAMTRHRELELSEAAYRANPIIREAMAHVAHIPIRNRGTVVGSLCHADAAAEMPMILVLTGGSVVAEGPSGRRTIAADDFFQFHMTTSRRPDELIVEAHFPVLPEGAGAAFDEFTRRHGDYAIAAVGAIVGFGEDGRARGVRVATCGIGSRPMRLAEAEARLEGTKIEASDLAAAGEAAKAAVTAPDDMHATTSYRRRVVSTLVRRVVETAARRARKGR
ncbi:MAG TPA: xanthine dehydrogenase family protein subunit M [Bauldia sp.]|nr:xanthine dehydrogenase family protein subunit M [Bauldia sp.]